MNILYDNHHIAGFEKEVFNDGGLIAFNDLDKNFEFRSLVTQQVFKAEVATSNSLVTETGKPYKFFKGDLGGEKRSIIVLDGFTAYGIIVPSLSSIIAGQPMVHNFDDDISLTQINGAIDFIGTNDGTITISGVNNMIGFTHGYKTFSINTDTEIVTINVLPTS